MQTGNVKSTVVADHRVGQFTSKKSQVVKYQKSNTILKVVNVTAFNDCDKDAIRGLEDCVWKQHLVQ